MLFTLNQISLIMGLFYNIFPIDSMLHLLQSVKSTFPEAREMLLLVPTWNMLQFALEVKTAIK